ncbi:hypothetical protein HPP92_011176 [Vanilla planifolia]|uniref:Nodulation signaling pathway 2-like protein n=1 Tax=Vanilla planifolia TaxID=51239 RepID=A0A835R5I5_VANPL|nr:hypothetical protein HPP92_011176 [Vanilla planifolia]
MEPIMEVLPGRMMTAGSSTTTTSVEEDISWDDWSPEINWNQVSTNPDYVFHNLTPHPADTTTNDAFPLADAFGTQGWACNTSSATTSITSASTPTDEPISASAPAVGDSMAFRLFHLLAAVAEALSIDKKNRDLARVILIRLRELASPTGTTDIERLAFHFTNALQSLLDSATSTPRGNNPHLLPSQDHYPPSDVTTAFQLLQNMSPYFSFGHLTANQAILEEISGERVLHVIDYNISEGVQWASLIQAISSAATGSSPPPHLKITAVANVSRRSASVAHETGRRLAAFAASLGQPFSFRICRLDHDRRFRPAAVKVNKGEAIFFNCILQPAQLDHCSAASVGSFLAGAAKMGARLVTLIEEVRGDVCAAGEHGGGFVGTFIDELERYVVFCESLVAGFPKQGRVREMVERMILAPRIAGAVRRAYGLHAGSDSVTEGITERMPAAGFDWVPLSFFNLSQARLLVGLFHDGFHIEEDAPNKVVLWWKSRRLLSASVWGVRRRGRCHGTVE